MNGPERAAAARSAAAVVTELNETVEGVSKAIRANIRRGLRPLGPTGSASMEVADAQHAAVHHIISTTARLSGNALSEILLRNTAPDAASVHDDPVGVARLAALNAAFGDTLPPELSPELRLFVDPLDERTGSLVVFVHGLGMHEQNWSADYHGVVTDSGFTPVRARYSTGQSVVGNGRGLSRALTDLVATWPVEVTRIVLVGHSMGGLVVAAALASEDGESWIGSVSELITLGTPFRGAPLERFARAALRAGGSASEVARPIFALGDRRSLGIKDLGDGIVLQLPDGVHHHAAVAAVGDSMDSVRSHLLGDGIVPMTSASGHEPDAAHVTVHHLPQSSHVGLLDHEAIADLIRRTCQGPSL